ncbi:DUF2510 domain-containing protein [Mumia zhuanghuii]|uniref:DUF2510 domain-containing protein n=1 Tax=Mumia zhuanghuii TaxID=2585211 RepID=A0A5C4MH46_9ACTN|nr:DUF2510 domain-containing protein [Mumia zhuanghuii]TNC38828.1 DUF2510 domain-containing protein [Mumia zhuanghuii]TNC51793.1 DUF2510 domain-containing protein [Mumia zhuanghuii]
MEAVTMDVRRRVHSTPELVRMVLTTALQESGFTIELARGSAIEARSGSQWLPRLGGKRPLVARANVALFGDHARVDLHLCDGERLLVDVVGAVDIYRRLFEEVLSHVDEALRSLDPQLETETPSVADAAEGLSAQKQLNAWMQRVYRTKGLQKETVRLSAMSGVRADLTGAQGRGLLAMASIISTDAAIPASIQESLDRLQADLRAALNTGSGSGEGPTVIEVDERGKRVVDFLHRQVLARQKLPEREIRRCRDCGQEKIFNPQIEKGAGQRAMLGVAGAAATVAYNPFAAVSVAGRIAGMRAAGSRFTCPRCQGTHVEVTPATLCPRCRSIRKEPVLRRCTAEGCDFNFLEGTEEATVWTPLEATDDDASPSDTLSRKSYSEPTADQPAPGAASPVTAERTTRPGSTRSDPAPGWYPDPAGRHGWRYYDAGWSWHVADQGRTTVDRLTLSAAPPSGDAQTPSQAAGAHAAAGTSDPSIPPTAPIDPRPGWYPDPTGRHELRYYEGGWSWHVVDQGRRTIDPPA